MHHEFALKVVGERSGFIAEIGLDLVGILLDQANPEPGGNTQKHQEDQNRENRAHQRTNDQSDGCLGFLHIMLRSEWVLDTWVNGRLALIMNDLQRSLPLAVRSDP